MSEIVLAGVSVAYDGQPVVRDIDLTVHSGEWLTLIGPNGAGNTTILPAVARAVAFRGDIRIGGRALTALSSRAVARQVAVLDLAPRSPVGVTDWRYVRAGVARHL